MTIILDHDLEDHLAGSGAPPGSGPGRPGVAQSPRDRFLRPVGIQLRDEWERRRSGLAKDCGSPCPTRPPVATNCTA